MKYLLKGFCLSIEVLSRTDSTVLAEPEAAQL